jgi:competence protein ComFC
MLALARNVARTFVSLCYPPHCESCRADTAPGVYLCERCVEFLRRVEPPFCRRCSRMFEGAITDDFVCDNCHGREVHYECAVAAYFSGGVVREMIHAFKYEQQLHLRLQLGAWLAETLDDPRIAGRPYDAFVPVPLHHVRFREREFNQADELAALISKRTGKPAWRALRRTRYTTTQTRLSREERMENLHGAFRVRHTSRVKGRHLLLVDDVFTTGSTVEECSRVLLRAGAASVRVITVARG